MKSFLTLFMATAMIGTALSANAKIPWEKAMMLKKEGKTIEQVYKTRDRNALKPLKQVPPSGFHRMLAQKKAQIRRLNSQSKVTALGDNIFGYLGYCDDTADLPVGYYELEPQGAKLLWEDPYFAETGLACNNVAKTGNKIVGYVQDEVFGMLYGIYYVEYDAETGEVLTVDEQDIEFNRGYIGLFAYNPEDDKFYGYGSFNGTRCYLSAPAWEPFNYSMIKPLQGREMCVSMCYNPVEKAIVGINLNYELVKIGKDGRQTKIMDLNVKNGDSYVTGMVYSPRSNVYYWNINYTDGTAAMATIDPVNKKLDVYEELDHCEEYYNLFTSDEYISNPDEPLTPEAGTPDFGKGELVGYVPFTLPTRTKGGKDISGEVEYTTYVNGEVYTTGKVETGKEKDENGNPVPAVVRANFAVPEAGKYSFSLTVKVNGLESAKASTYAWIGNDTPMDPTEVRLSKSESGSKGSYTVTWNHVKGGVHGGYVDIEQLEYKVRINGEEYTCVTNRLDIDLPDDKDLEAYTASVKAVCNGLESEWVSSNTVTEGMSIPLPMFITPTPDQYEVSMVIDNNKDGRTWMLEESQDPENPYFIQTNFTNTAKEHMDDWYFLPKMKIEDASTFYSFTMETGIRSSSFPNEYIEVLLCDEPSVEGVTDTIIKEFRPLTVSYDKVYGLFKVASAGDYYLALHCKSEGLQMGVKARNFEVAQSDATHDSPAAVKQIDVTPGRKGALKATVSFQMPTMNLGNKEIDPNTTLKATISSPVESKTVTGLPGQVVYTTVETEQGINTITVQISNGESNSLVSKTTVYTGVYIPATPQLTGIDYSPDMLSMTLTWDPVTVADDGEGYVNPATVVYNIYRLDLNTNRWYLHQEGVTENSYIFQQEPGSVQDIIMLGVLSSNEAGNNGELITAMGVLGTPYELPITENFDNNGTTYTNPWVTTYLYGDSGSWGLYYNSDITGDSKDKGISMVAQGNNGDVSRLGCPKFSTKGLEDASITLELFNTNMPCVRILAEMYGEEPEVIGEINSKDFKNRIEKATVTLPARYLDKEWVGLYIETEFDDDNQILVIESISIDGAMNAVSSIEGENVMISSGKGHIKVTGLKGNPVTVTNINGTIVGKKAKTNEAVFNVDKGIYVVASGTRKAKVIVR
ncbi:MAG: hypothetical protein K2N25_05230 [Muribaculaceae bacterium]|nr:hypothetical protein [Muribaculaceae bacterium]